MKYFLQTLFLSVSFFLTITTITAQQWDYLKLKKYFATKPPLGIEGFFEIDSDGDRKYLIGIIKTNTEYKVYYLAGKMEYWSDGTHKGFITARGTKLIATWDEGIKPGTISYSELTIESNSDGFKLNWPDNTPDYFKRIKLIESDIAFNRYRDNTIKMVRSASGIFEIPALINGVLKISLILDTGASEVSISPDIALTLYKAKTINEKDWLPGKYYRFADGNTAKSDRFIIRSLIIGNYQLRDIEASISNSIESPLLLGQNALQQLGKIQIDYVNNEFRILN